MSIRVSGLHLVFFGDTMIESSEKKAKTRAPREIFPHDSHDGMPSHGPNVPQFGPRNSSPIFRGNSSEKNEKWRGLC